MKTYKDIVDAEPQLHNNQLWREVDSIFRVEGLPGYTYKMELGAHDLYVKMSWYKGKIVRIDVTLSRKGHAGDGLPKTAKEATLEATRFDLAKASLEEICIQASDLLQGGQVGIGHIVQDWRGREMYPSGWCPQLPEANAQGDIGPSRVMGPTDAVAKLIQRNLVRWTEEMEGS